MLNNNRKLMIMPVLTSTFPYYMQEQHRPEPEEVSDVEVSLADPELKRPSLYAVVMYNDDYTPMDFVVEILQNYFNHHLEKAVEIMLTIHHQGKAIVGIYPKDIAETKSIQANHLAQQAEYPLLTMVEPQGDN